jgi:hypothetical protein
MFHDPAADGVRPQRGISLRGPVGPADAVQVLEIIVADLEIS